MKIAEYGTMARLSCIRLTEEEKTAFAMELDMIMNYLDNLKNADTREWSQPLVK